jgi:hypothetical protein
MQGMKCLGACAALLLATAGQLQAGTIFTNQADFNAAIAGLNPLWSEDFEGFALGSVSDPLPIAGGAAEVVDSGIPFVTDLGAGNVWRQPDGAESNATIQGKDATALGVHALSFVYAYELYGAWNFVTTLDTDSSPVVLPPPLGDPTDRIFLGWVGDPGETLNLAQYNEPGGTVLDDITAYSAIPEPTSLAIFGFGALGLVAGGIRRRKRQNA